MLFECLDERGFGITRRRLCEVLAALQADKLYGVAFVHGRQDSIIVIFGCIIAPFHVDGDEARLDQRRAIGAQHMSRRTVFARSHIDGDGIKYGVSHLAGDRTLPDQRIQSLKIMIDAPFKILRQYGGGGRADRLVRFLRIA